MERDIIIEELIVVGKDSIHIDLGRRHPKLVSVRFKPSHHHRHPCNHHQDKVEAFVKRRDHLFILIIEWDVSSPRDIIWEVIM